MTEPAKDAVPAATPAVEPEGRHDDRNTGRWIAAGAAMGIGSAALVAALLYTNRNKAAPKPKPAPDPSGPAPESD